MEEAISNVCLDYAEGFYNGDSERLNSALHDDLVKRTIRNDRIEEMNRQDVIAASTEEDREQPTVSVEILDIDDGYATARVQTDYLDYIHLARINGKWKIVNVLWDQL